MTKIRFISDATAGLPRAFCDREGVWIAPIGIQTQDGMLEEKWLEDMAEPETMVGAKTSQAQVHVLFKLFERALLAGEAVVCLTLSAALSGTYSAAKLAAEMLNADIHVIDTKTGVGGQRILIENAVKRRNEGKDLGEILSALRYEIDHCTSLFTTGDLNALRLSGRLSGAEALLGGMLKVHPVLGLDAQGAMQVLGKVRGEGRALDTLLGLLPEGKGRVAVCYTKELEKAQKLLERVKEMRPNSVPKLMRAGAVIACHLGLSAFGFVHIESPEDAK